MKEWVMYPYRWAGRRFGFPVLPVVFLLLVLMVFSWRPVLFMVIPLAIVAFAFFSAWCGGWRGWHDWHEGWSDQEKPKNRPAETIVRTGQSGTGDIYYL
jgi:hypothetical protein